MIIEKVEAPDNPFPGLRPFNFNESHLFFGRDGLSSELLERLGETSFLAVIGTSGSGKSSLVHAGLLPALCGGFMKAGSDWRVAVMRPGNDPIGELAQALNDPTVLGTAVEENKETQRFFIESTLRLGSPGLIEIVRQAKLDKDENLLIVVDQFEELFRFEPKTKSASSAISRNGTAFSARSGKNGTKHEKGSGSSANGNGIGANDAEKYGNEASDFVKLLLEAAKQKTVPIYVVITMRSEFLGRCAQFLGLPEAINQGQYLIPRLTRHQQREAITRPITVYKAEITPRLVSELLNDMGDDPDQLPLLQHALMRTWKKSTAKADDKKRLDLKHYQEVGGMAKALSQHAEFTYNYLDDKQKKIVEKMFKCLTVRDPEGHETRRPKTLKDICEIIEEDEEDVKKVIDDFRSPGRSFLMPPASEMLKPESQIDISHESLIRCWERLSQWVDDEARSAWTYCWVADTATALWDGKQKTELLRDRQAEFALNWYEESKPNKAWAELYHDANFEVVKDFLEKSKELYQKEHEDLKEILRKFTRILKTVLPVICLLFVAISIFAVWNWLVANKQTARVEEQRNVAEHRFYAAQMSLAQTSYDKGDYAAANAKLNWIRSVIDRNKNFDNFARFEWNYLWRLLHNETDTLGVQSDIPVNSVAFSKSSRRIAVGTSDGKVQLWDADNKRLIHEWFVSRGASVRSVAFSPADENVLATASADRSVTLWDVSTRNSIWNLRKPDELSDKQKQSERISSAVAFSPNGELLAAGGAMYSADREAMSAGESAQGTITVWNLKTKQEGPAIPLYTNNSNAVFARSIAFNHYGKMLAIGTDYGVEIWSVTPEGKLAFAKSLAFYGDGFRIEATGNDSGSKGWAIIGSTGVVNKISEEPKTSPRAVLSVAFSPANILAIGSSDSKVRLWDITNSKMIELNAQSVDAHSKEVSSVAFSPGGERLVTGSYDGSIRWWDTTDSFKKSGGNTLNDKSAALKPLLTGHSDYINSIAFSPDGKTLVSGSKDGTAKLWDTTAWGDGDKSRTGQTSPKENKNTKLEEISLTIDSNAVLSVAFAGASLAIRGGGSEENLRLFPIQELLAKLRQPSDLDPTKKLIEKYETAQPQRNFITSVSPQWASSMSVSFSRRLLAAGYNNGNVKIWDLSKGQELQDRNSISMQQTGSERILSVSFSSDEKLLAASNENMVKVWQIDSGQLLSTSEQITGSVAIFSPTKAELLATADKDGSVKIWNAKTGKQVKDLTEQEGDEPTRREQVLTIAFSHDGNLLAAGSADGRVVLWNINTMERMKPLKAHSDAISSLAFSSKNDRLATGSYDGSVKLWDVNQQAGEANPPLELITLKTFSTVISVSFSPDDHVLVAGGGDGSLWIWRAFSKDEPESNQN